MKYLLSRVPEFFSVKVAIVFWVVNVLVLGGIYAILSLNDPGLHLKFLLLGLTSGCVWAFFVGVLARNGGVRRHGLCLLLPYLYLLAEFINLGSCPKIYFCCQIFSFFLYGAFLLVLDILLRQWVLPRSGVFWRGLSVVVLAGEALIFLFPVLLIFNRLVSGGRVDSHAVIAMIQSDWWEAYYYFFHQNNGLLILFCVCLVIIVGVFVIGYALKHSGTAGSISGKRAGLVAAIFLVLAGGWWLGVRSISVNQLYPSLIEVILKTPFLYANTCREYQENHARHSREVQELLKSEKGEGGYNGIFVLIIGESLNRHRMNCYGYELPTTPFQTRARSDNSFFFFDHAYSNHVQTVQVLSLALTQKNQYSGEELSLHNVVSLLDIARFCGYKTKWFSNQGRSWYDFAPTAILADSADSIFFLQAKAAEEKRRAFDSELKTFVPELSSRELLIIHLQGSHFPYSNCAPDDFSSPARWTSYDRSVLFNDFVIGGLVTYFKEKKAAAIIYCSDHSEGVSMERGHDPRPERFLPEMVDIPLWVYLGEEYASAHPEVAAELRRSRTKYFTNDLLFNLVLAVMGISNRFTPDRYNVLSEHYMVNAANAVTLWGSRKITGPQE